VLEEWFSSAMLTGLLVVIAAGVCAILASRFMWWATSRSPLWAMAAGVLLLFAIIAGAVVIAWWFTIAEYGP
jgi:hypothetical protein